MELMDSFLFKNISEKQFKCIEKELPDVSFLEKGESISSKMKEKSIGLILEGELRVYRKGTDGKEKLCNRLLPGGAVGAASLYGGAKTFSNVIVYKKAKILFLTEEKLTKLWKSNPQIAENYIRFLTDRIRYLNTSVNASRGANHQGKVEKFLFRYADEQGKVNLPVSLSGLASKLNMGRSSLYRALDDLTEKGIIYRDGKIIYVTKKGTK